MSDAENLPTPPEPITRASKEIMALHSGAELKPVIPTTLEEAFRFAQLVCQAGLAPKSYEYGDGDKRPDPQKVVVGILTSLELGVPPLQGLSGIAIINGRPSVWGDLAVALVQSKGLIESHEVTETGTFPKDDYTVTVKFWRRGQAKPYEGRFSVADAKLAGLWNNPKKQPWVSYPKRMVFNRARAFPLRDGFSDALKGLAIAEEMMDLPVEPKVPVSTAFLEDDTAAAEPAQPQAGPAASDTAPEPETPPSEAPEAQDGQDYAAELEGYIAALAGVETVIKLRELDEEVKGWFSNMTAQDPMLRGQWSAAKLSREKELAARKTGK